MMNRNSARQRAGWEVVRTRVWFAALALSAAAACGGSSKQTPSEEATPALEPVAYGLHALPLIPASPERPPAYDKGVESFDLGEAAYQAKRYEDAAEEFLDAGLTFQVPAGTPHQRELLNMSELSCRNAALSWRMLREMDKVKTVHSDVNAEFPACASGLEQEFPKPPAF